MNFCDDPRTPLLGRSPNHASIRSTISRTASHLCSGDSWRRRLPISIWLPKYQWSYLLRDAIAGITVGLTSIPQGIAYAIIAGVPPQVGLYSSIFPGIVYAFFGSCNVVTVGPTAILAALLSKYVVVSVDFAYLAAFLSGCVILLLGILQLGFLLDFISKPVICGFTTAAALQIAASQLKSLFHISGKSGDTFITAIANFVTNIKTVKLWDMVLGFSTILALILLKKVQSASTADRDGRVDIKYKVCVAIVRARNAIVVCAGAAIGYVLYVNGRTPFALTGKIDGGLPHFGPPPFSTAAGNRTYDFEEMLEVFGAEGLVMPLVAILESIAIAKAFAGTTRVDATQEMVAVGLCNVVSSFCQCMPVTGSFTRTALNHASGVATPAGSLFKASLVLLSVTLMTRAFYFIPRATLAAVIMVAMYHIVDLAVVKSLWKNSKYELCVYTITILTGVSLGLEYGILCGASCDIARLLYRAARPEIHSHIGKVGHQEYICVKLTGSISYPSAEFVTEKLKVQSSEQPAVLVFDGTNLMSLDYGVAENMIAVIFELEQRGHRVILWQFTPGVQKLLEGLNRNVIGKFVNGGSLEEYVLRISNGVQGITR